MMMIVLNKLDLTLEEFIGKIIRCVLVNFSGAVFVRNPLNREMVATFEIIVSVHDNASDIIDKSGSVPNGKSIS